MSRADLEAMIDGAQPFPREQYNGNSDGQPSSPEGTHAVLVRADTIRPEPINWLWHDWLAAGKLHILAGAPGTGKTTLALAFAAAISCGGLWPDRTRTTPGSVVMWSGEDDPADVLVPRLLAMGALPSRVHIISGITGPDGRRAFDPARDIDLLAAPFADIPDLRLMIVDPIVSAVAGDSHHNAETRRSLQPLVDLAAAHRCGLLGITHLSKGTAGKDPVERVTGSVAFGALARIVLMTVREQTEEGKPGRRLLVRAKSNIGLDTGGYAYELRHEELAGHPGIFPSAVVWGDGIEGTARELLAVAEQQDDEHAERRDGAAWLRDLLTDGAMPVKDVRRAADDAGHAWRTVQRAMKAAGVISRRSGFAKPITIWSLADGSTSAPCAPHSERGADGADGVSSGADGSLT